MNIEVWRLAVDFALVVLIWMVQLLIYPGFRHFSATGLAAWHPTYTSNMTFIVAPLMIIQTGIAVYFILYAPYMFAANILYALLIAANWLVTFFIFIPLHQRIDREPGNTAIAVKITRLNWMRVILWSLILGLDMILLY